MISVRSRYSPGEKPPTGDYCGGSQNTYFDGYGEGLECVRPIYNCVGNHDTVGYVDHYFDKPKNTAHERLFNKTDNWDVNFMPCEYSTSYYKDFPESGIRMIVLDLYYDVDLQIKWLGELLARSLEEGISVITVMHEPSSSIVRYVDTTFNSLSETNGEYRRVAGEFTTHPYEAIIADFIKNGGKHICNLCGHLHHDLFGYTEGGVLNIAVECATNWYHWSDGIRIKDTRTYDCFNVMAVNVNLGTLSLTRIGNNVDSFMRRKETLCYDYLNKRVIFN